MNKYIDPANKLLAHLDRVVAINDGEHPAPVNVEIDLTNRCNLGCDDCHFGHVHTRGPLAKRRTHDTGDVFPYPLIKQVLHDMEAAGVRSVVWTGGGEPTLHPFFDVIVHDCLLPQGIYTNGTLIDENRAALMKRRMEWVYVSMDNHTQETYLAYKKVDAFDKACQGVCNLVAAPGRATIGVGYLIGADNWQLIPEMIAHGLSLGADYVNFRPMIEFEATSPINPSAGRDWISEALPTLEACSLIEKVILDVERFIMYRDWAGHPYKICQWAQMQTVITPDARVWTCVNRRGYDGSLLGDLHEDTFEEVWARSKAFLVNQHCRVMCRGHLANVALSAIRQSKTHSQFI
jgi:GTP 3',8-cyclase